MTATKEKAPVAANDKGPEEKTSTGTLAPAGAANKPKACGGCGKPFNLLRKVRSVYTDTFMPFRPGTQVLSGSVAARPVPLCGACRDHIDSGGRPYDLPEMQRGAEYMELLSLAEPRGSAC